MPDFTTSYELRQANYDQNKWYFVEKTIDKYSSILTDIVYIPKNGTLTECLKLIKQHEKIYSKEV